MAAQPHAGPIWTVEQYLALERHSTVKHEYHRGYVYAVAGGTQAHSQIAVNVCALLRAGVRGSGCRALNSDIKIRQSPEDYVYADAVVTCYPRDHVPGQDWINYPTLIVEVLSPSTAGYDRDGKFDDYKAIATLREYILVEQGRRAVQVWRRGDDGAWMSAAFGPDGAVMLASLDLTLTLDEIYEDSGV
jgi:Uma2 family endonuclease